MGSNSSSISIAEELSRLDFFWGFPDSAMQAFARLTKHRDFKPSENLLVQGQNNTSLFFLLSGKLQVFVDDELVSELSEVGEVVGEMSLINKTKTTATVRAITEVRTFEVNEGFLDSLAPEEREKTRALFDRVYASLLVERLARTNKRAKNFEIANRQLSATQKRLELINENLEVEISRRSKEIVEKVRSLTESHLRPTQLTLAVWSQADTINVDRRLAKNMFETITEVIDFLKPVSDLADADLNRSARRVLLVESSKKQQTAARLALGGTGIELEVAACLEDVVTLSDAHEFDLVLCESSLKQAAHFLMQKKPDTSIVILVDLDRKNYLQMMQEFPEKVMFVSRDPDNRTFTIKNISTTVSKILHQDIFGIERYLASGCRVLEQKVSASEMREQQIEKMCEHFRSLGVRSSFLDRMQTVAEELLMNAIYDAPTDQSGKALFNHLPRTEPVVLSPNQQAKLRYGTDGILLGVSVTDPFGSLSKGIIKKYLEGNSEQEEQANPTQPLQKGGAGRGLRLLIESSDLTVFNIHSQRKTEVISLFYLEGLSETASSTFHLFQIS